MLESVPVRWVHYRKAGADDKVQERCGEPSRDVTYIMLAGFCLPDTAPLRMDAHLVSKDQPTAIYSIPIKWWVWPLHINNYTHVLSR